MTEEQIKAKVAEWNSHYRELGREVRLKDMVPEAYEATVGSELLGLCDEDPELAVAVFKHADNEGGWMCGDVVAFIERQ